MPVVIRSGCCATKATAPFFYIYTYFFFSSSSFSDDYQHVFFFSFHSHLPLGAKWKEQGESKVLRPFFFSFSLEKETQPPNKRTGSFWSRFSFSNFFELKKRPTTKRRQGVNQKKQKTKNKMLHQHQNFSKKKKKKKKLN